MRRLHRVSLIGLVLVLAMIAAACSSDTEETTTTTAPPETTTTTEAPFDLVAAVDEYLSTLPDGFYAVADMQAFKDGVAASEALVIDVRETSEYEEGHIPGAVNIPIRTVAQSLDKIPTDRQVYVYCRTGFRAAESLTALGILGYDNILSYKPGWVAWSDAGEEFSTEATEAPVIGAPDIEPALLEAVNAYLEAIPDSYYSAGSADKVLEAAAAGTALLDVRTAGEYADGHIEDAPNIDLRSLALGFEAIPTDKNVIDYCGSGHRAGMSVAALHILGLDNITGYGGSYQSLVDAGAAVVAP